jgi:hypothetical protein
MNTERTWNNAVSQFPLSYRAGLILYISLIPVVTKLGYGLEEQEIKVRF